MKKTTQVNMTKMNTQTHAEEDQIQKESKWKEKEKKNWRDYFFDDILLLFRQIRPSVVSEVKVFALDRWLPLIISKFFFWHRKSESKQDKYTHQFKYKKEATWAHIFSQRLPVIHDGRSTNALRIC